MFGSPFASLAELTKCTAVWNQEGGGSLNSNDSR